MRSAKLASAVMALLTLGVGLGCGGGSGSPTSTGAPPPPPPPPPTGESTASATATYRVTFDATWSAATHPAGIPPNPHFSPLIGATHLEETRFWEVGAIASDGIKAMAEEGKTTPLDNEINRAISQGRAERLLQGKGISRSPGTVRLDFEVSLEHPFVTLVSMLAPSPDWFVGVSALPLLENGDWVQRLDVELFAYDAGTDGGVNYTSANRPLNPRLPIEKIEKSPFVVDGALRSVGTFTFRRLSSSE